MSIMLLTWARYISQVGSQTDLSQMKKPNAIFKCSIDTVVLSSPDVEMVSSYNSVFSFRFKRKGCQFYAVQDESLWKPSHRKSQVEKNEQYQYNVGN